jgi:hypothetical protein
MPLLGHLARALVRRCGGAGGLDRGDVNRSLSRRAPRETGAESVAEAVEQAERDGGVRGLIGWSALRQGTPPNAVAWGT